MLGCKDKLDSSDVDSASSMESVVNAAETHSFFIEDGKIPTVAFDAASNKVYVAFFREADITGVFLVHKEISGESWSAPVRVSAPTDEASAHGQAPAQVAVGPEGNVYVVWTNSIPVEGRRFPASNLLFARSMDGGLTFSPPKAINSDADGLPAGHTFHDVTVGSDGTIYVSWLDSRDRYRALAQAMTKNPVQQVSLDTHSHSAEAHEPGTQVWVAYSSDQGKSFSEGTVVAKETCQCCRTSIVAASDGKVYVAWRHIFPGMERDMALAYSEDGAKTFTEPRRIYADHWSIEGCPHSGPSLVIDAAGRFHVAWYTGEESKPGLYYSTSEDGIAFSEPMPLATGVGVSQVRLSGHGQDRVWLAWEDKNRDDIQVAYSDGGGTLKKIDALPSASSPALIVSPEVWITAGQEKGGMRITQGTP